VSHRSARCLIKLLYYLFVVCCVHSAANELIIIIIFFSISYLVFPRIFCLSAIEAYIFIKSQCAPSVYGVHYHYYIYQVALCDQSKINLPANNSWVTIFIYSYPNVPPVWAYQPTTRLSVWNYSQSTQSDQWLSCVSIIVFHVTVKWVSKRKSASNVRCERGRPGRPDHRRSSSIVSRLFSSFKIILSTVPFVCELCGYCTRPNRQQRPPPHN